VNREPISPELVLVDPELAESARRALPEFLTVADFGGHRLVRLPPRALAPPSARSIWLPRAVVAATASAAVAVAAGVFESREVDREPAPLPDREATPRPVALERTKTPRAAAGRKSLPAPRSARAEPAATTTTAEAPRAQQAEPAPEARPAPATRRDEPAAPAAEAPRAQRAEPAPEARPAPATRRDEPAAPAAEAPRTPRKQSPAPAAKVAPRPAPSQAPAPKRRTTTTREEPTRRTQPPAREEPKPEDQPAPAPQELQPGIGAPAQSGETSRVLYWQPVAGASRYTFGFFRAGRQIFEASPTEPRVTVPSSWTYRGVRFTLQAGQYGWNVHAALARERKLVVRATWDYAGG